MAVISECTSADASNLTFESRIRLLAIIIDPTEVWLKFRIIIITSIRQQFSPPLNQFAIIANPQKNALVSQKGKIGKGDTSREGNLAQFLEKCRVNKQCKGD